MPGRHFLHNLFAERSLIYQLVRRDFRQRYVGSIAGWLWGVVHPLVLLAVYTFVFGAVGAKLPVGEVTDNFPMFLFCGMLPWLLFSETLQRSAPCLVEYSTLIKKSVFPSEIAPLTILLSTVISHLLALAMLLVAVAVWLETWSLALLSLPLVIVLLALLSLGMAWIVAALHVYLRDTAQVLAVALTAWFWLTPIFFSEQTFPRFARLNPLTYAIRGYRDVILGAQWPAWQDMLILTACSGTFFLIGALFFRHAKRGFADVL